MLMLIFLALLVILLLTVGHQAGWNWRVMLAAVGAALAAGWAWVAGLF